MTDNSTAPLALIPKSDDGDFLKTVAEAPLQRIMAYDVATVRNCTPPTASNGGTRRANGWADVVGIFLNETSTIGLVDAALMEQHDEWQLQHRYLSLEPLAISVSSVRRNRTYLFQPSQCRYLCSAWPERLHHG